MSAFYLKLIACFTMLIDHITYYFIPQSSSFYFVGRGIGRLAFPIFCFLLVEGFFHTRKLSKYLIRLLIFGIVSEAAFDFANYGFEFSRYLEGQNVYLTLLIGIIAISLLELVKKKYLHCNALMYNIVSVLIIIASGFLAFLLKTDYSANGILLILLFYYFRANKKILGIALILYYVVFYASQSPISMAALFSLPFILMYQGQKGRSLKYFFYLFYPLHLVLIGCIVHFLPN